MPSDILELYSTYSRLVCDSSRVHGCCLSCTVIACLAGMDGGPADVDCQDINHFNRCACILFDLPIRINNVLSIVALTMCTGSLNGIEVSRDVQCLFAPIFLALTNIKLYLHNNKASPPRDNIIRRTEPLKEKLAAHILFPTCSFSESRAAGSYCEAFMQCNHANGRDLRH